MTTTKHTPGPWWVSFNADPKTGPLFQHNLMNQHINGPAQAEANARLMGEAPALLAVLEHAAGIYADEFDGPKDQDLQVSGADLVDWFTEWRQTAKAAIAKAKGAP